MATVKQKSSFTLYSLQCWFNNPLYCISSIVLINSCKHSYKWCIFYSTILQKLENTFSWAALHFCFGVKKVYSFSMFSDMSKIKNWRSLGFVAERKCETKSTRKKRASTIMEVTTSLSKLRLSQVFIIIIIFLISGGLRDFIDPSWRLLSFQQVDTEMRSSVFAVWMECTSSPFRTTARGAASIYRMARPVLRPSSTVARRLKPTVLRQERKASYWLEVRDDSYWVLTRTCNLNTISVHKLAWYTRFPCSPSAWGVSISFSSKEEKNHCAPEAM